MSTPKTSDNDPQAANPKQKWIKLVVLLIVVAVPVIVAVFFRDKFSLDYLAEREAALKAFQGEHPLAVYGIAFAIYVFVTALSIPGAGFMSLLMGWYFGVVRGTLLVSFASTTGATLAFLISRYLFRDAVQSRFGHYLTKFNQALAKEGAFYLFTLRLIVGVPFFVINLVMGLTPVPATTFWWVSQLGMLPGTILYCYAGSSVPDLQTLAREGIGAVFSAERLIQIFLAFGLLGVFPLLVKKLFVLWKPSVAAQAADETT